MQVKVARLELEVEGLRKELEDSRIERRKLERFVGSLQSEMSRSKQIKELFDLGKLLLAGTLVPAASACVLYWVMDGSLISLAGDR